MPSVSRRVVRKSKSKGRRFFIGYDDATIDELFRDFRRRIAPPAASQVLEHVTLIPLTRIQKGHFCGGPYSGETHIEHLLLHRGFGRKRASRIHADPSSSSRAPEIEFETAWFGGYLFSHYGHFLLESISRSVYSDVISSPDKIIFFNPQNITTLPRFIKDVFNSMGISEDRIILCDQPMRVAHLHVREPALEISNQICPDAYCLALPRVDADAIVRSGSVFLSRGGLSGKKRSIDGEAAIEGHLTQKFGTRIIHPEQHSVPEQVDILSSAGAIIGCEGSAFHTALLARSTAPLIMLCDAAPHVNYLLCDEAIDGDAVYIRCGDDQAEERSRDWRMNIERARSGIEFALDLLTP